MDTININNSSDSVLAVYVISGAIGGLALVALSLLYMFQDKLLYFPKPPGFPTIPEHNPRGCISPGEWKTDGEYSGGGPDAIPFEDVRIETEDGVSLHAWLLLRHRNAPTLLYFHGNAGNMGFCLQNAVHMYSKSDFNVLMIDYRGYGHSTGVPCEAGLKRDAAAVISFARKHAALQESPVVLFGRSLGGAVALSLAEKCPGDVAGVILENTFLSIPSMVDVLMPVISPLKWIVLRIHWNSEEFIHKLTQPILFISGDADELVPTSHMKKLYDLATSSVNRIMFSVPGGTHNDTWIKAGKTYYHKLKEFGKIVKKYHNQNDQYVIIDKNHENDNNEIFLSNDNNDNNYNNFNTNIHLPTMTKSFKVQ